MRLKVEVAPLQAEDFADAKSRTLRHHDHRSVRFRKMLEHLNDLSHFENLWPLQPLARILDTHESNGVLANLDNSPALAALQDEVH